MPKEACSTRRNRTKADRAKASGEIQYDHTQDLGDDQSQADKSATLPLRSGGPVVIPMLRTSERTTFKRCRWLWKLEFVELRKPNFDTPALMFGSMIHIALRDYYKKGIRRGPHPAGLFEAAVVAEAERCGALAKVRPHELMEKWRARIDLGVGMLNNYVESYGKDDQWEVLSTELPFQVIVVRPRDGATPWFYYTGILDLLIKDRSTEKKLIVDHKTAAAIQTQYLALDEQTTSYWTWGVEALRRRGLIGFDEQIDGLTFNFLRKQMPDERAFVIEGGKKYYTNLDGSISKKQPSPYFHRETVWRHNLQMERSRERAVAEMLDMKAVRLEPERGAYKNNGKFTCAGCWAFDICSLHEIGADYQSLIEQTTHTWDPYEAHEIYFGEAR